MTEQEAKDILKRDEKCKKFSNSCLMVDCEWCEYFCLAYEIDEAKKVLGVFDEYKRNY